MTDAELSARLRANILGFRTVQACHGPLRVWELPGVRAFTLPGHANSLFQHQVLYEDARALAEALAPLEAWYREQGVRAWRVPVYPGDVAAEAELARAGYRPDGVLPAMGLPLAPPPSHLPAGTTLEHPEHLDELLTLNGLFYGEESVVHLEAWRTRMPPAHVHAVMVREAGRVLAAGLTFEQEGTAGIYLVATHPEARRMGLGTRVMQGLHADAHARGCTAVVLQASPMGHGLYQRLGYRDLGRWTNWVRRAD
ncbi:GNAT family N-acetyltransferase [Vitiosangium sp. GDMCC 1.1324]|uniref:GNAT family N-acetyltransferase n=1 Tax=Vitiosangium sp. (strain GDMCC 1.1324) TaxID=2138576 RepID=UPI000D34DADE|nr:GNAT family N-acetyltransferase [Vitiosangium sp. GDMCC 1.1324]PTL84745.1 GNAT family N-acetyltransferase [Vitiosangium sp. GDMCC 1.1324]